MKTLGFCQSGLLHGLFNCDCNRNRSADHGVVAHAQEAHHLDVRRDGGGACELCIGVHTAHGVGHAVGSGACGHVVRVQGTARAAAGSDGEILLALLDALFLVRAGDRVLEAGGVRGVLRREPGKHPGGIPGHVCSRRKSFQGRN